MMPRLFRRMWKSAPAARAAYRPAFDTLEDRSLPSVAGVIAPLAPPSLAHPITPQLPEGTNYAAARAATTAPDVAVTVAVNAPPTTIDLNAVFAKTGGVDPTLAPGLSFRIVGNDNPDLVTARLSDEELILTFAAGQQGTARVTVSAIDAAGASVRVTFVVTVGTAVVVH
jgi:hypothetical protein